MDLSQITKSSSAVPFYVPASAYTFDELAEIYNETRIDYIVPMPMNAKRMADYVHFYDVDLELSTVVLSSDKLPIGLIMLGLRGDCAWITRLGMLPNQRGQRIGQSLMEITFEKISGSPIRRIKLEVITGNEPAHRLFLKIGFIEFRELLIIRRPPKPIEADLLPADAVVTALDTQAIADCLQHREPDIAWTEESASLLHIPNLQGIQITLPSGEIGWIVYQRSTFELAHVVIKPDISPELTAVLIYQLHKQHPLHDTKIENLPRAHPAWEQFQKLGYMEVFSRIEMYKNLC